MRSCTTISSPIGDLTLVADDEALCAVLWHDQQAADDVERVDRDGHPVLSVAAQQLDEYFAGERTDFDVPLRPHGTPFQLAAWEALQAIPFGETVSYGDQAARIGDRRKARAVGAANGRNPIPVIVPCHRVRGADGTLTGFGGGLETKAWLLDHERRILIS